MSCFPLRAVGAVLAGLSLLACGHVNPDYQPHKTHHRPDGFVNLHAATSPQPSFWRWQWERWGAALPADAPEQVARAVPDVAWLQRNRRDLSVTWVGHSTALWQVNGLNILTDPHWGARASPVGFAGPQRLTEPGLALADLPHIDLVLISHNHYDHLDRDTVHALQAQRGGPPQFVVPLGLDRWLRDEGITRVQALDWWDQLQVEARPAPLRVHLVPAHHWSSRTPWDRNTTLWGGFVVQTQVNGAPYQLYYAGDTGYAPLFATLAQRFGGFDFAQIPVGCYEPRWFMQVQHVNEDEAVRIHLDVRSRLSLGVHWGTFRLCDDPIQAPLAGLPQALARHGVAPDAFVLFKLGETRVLQRVSADPD